MFYEYNIKTDRENFHEITKIVHEAIKNSGMANGICVVSCPHTTAGITINENADPDVVRDMLLGLDKAFPDLLGFLHEEGNSTAHLKASCVGTSVTIPVQNHSLVLGTWQGIYFCEFDGPRQRKFHITTVSS